MKDTNTVAHIRAYLLSTGHRFIAESEMLEEAIRSLCKQGSPVSNKAIILRLMEEQAASPDASRQAVIRRLLRLVARYTPDA